MTFTSKLALVASCLMIVGAGVALAGHGEGWHENTCAIPECFAEYEAEFGDDSGGERQLEEVDGGRRLQDVFGTLPPGGWAANSLVSGGLEWMYAAPIGPMPDYFNVFPGHYQGIDSCWTFDATTQTFPDCVKNSGFRLPTLAEYASRPASAPPCMAAYGNNKHDHCDVGEYGAGSIWHSGVGTYYSCSELIYVRPVGTPDSCVAVVVDSDGDGVPDDADQCQGNDASGDSDSDGVCDDTDPCPNDPENDIDGDSVCGDVDPCPLDNPDDTDLDGVCDSDDVCEPERTGPDGNVFYLPSLGMWVTTVDPSDGSAPVAVVDTVPHWPLDSTEIGRYEC